MELQEALKVILPQKIIDFLMGTSDVKITNCKCDLCNKNGLNGAPEPKTIIEITHRYKYTSSPHEENVYTTTSYEPTLEEAIKVLQKHFTENKKILLFKTLIIDKLFLLIQNVNSENEQFTPKLINETCNHNTLLLNVIPKFGADFGNTIYEQIRKRLIYKVSNREVSTRKDLNG